MATLTKSTTFEEAVTNSRLLPKLPSQDELLELYALFKQATQDPKFEDSDVPGTFDFKGKAKYKAWKAVVDEGVTQEQAKERYIALVNRLGGFE